MDHFGKLMLGKQTLIFNNSLMSVVKADIEDVRVSARTGTPIALVDKDGCVYNWENILMIQPRTKD